MATWNGVITNAGNSLLNEWVNEKALNFDSAAAGQGTVAAAAMMAQTALVSQKQTASLLGGEKVSSGIRLKLRIAAPNTAYTLNQYGVWASVEGGSSTMITLFQLEQGIPIPSKTESPDFVYTFYALISCSNTGTWTVTVDTSACVTAGQDHGQGPAAGRWEREYLCGSRRKRLWLSTCNRLRSANSHDLGCRRAALLRQLYGQGIRLQRQGRQRQLSMDALRCQRRSRPDLQRRIARHLP